MSTRTAPSSTGTPLSSAAANLCVAVTLVAAFLAAATRDAGLAVGVLPMTLTALFGLAHFSGDWQPLRTLAVLTGLLGVAALPLTRDPVFVVIAAAGFYLLTRLPAPRRTGRARR